MEQFLNTIVRSSEDPEKVSMTIKGILTSYVGFILLLAHATGFPLAEAQVIEVISQVSLACGAVVMIAGAVRKIYYLFK